MRGSPLLRALLTLIAIALAGWPVWRITHAGTPIPIVGSAPRTASPAAPPARLQLDFLPAPPLEFTVQYLGQSIWRGGGKLTEESPPLEIKVPAEGVDLQVVARWPDDLKSAALRVRLITTDGATIERQAWTRDNASLNEVLTFQTR